MPYDNLSKNDDLIYQRRQTVAKLRLRGMTVRQIVDALPRNNPPFLNPETGEPYTIGTIAGDLKALRKEWHKEASADTAAHKAREFAELQEVKQLAWSQKDGRLALRALETEMKLLGTFEPMQLNIKLDLVVQLVEELNGAGIDATEFFTQAIERARSKRG